MDESDVDVAEKEKDEEEDQSQTEDSSAGMCNGSLGREILHTVQRNEQQQQQQQGKKVSRMYAQRVVFNLNLNLFL